MIKIRTQYHLVKDHIQKQMVKVYKKLGVVESKSKRELTNHEVALSLMQVAVQEQIPDRTLEKISDLICKLNIHQVHLVKLRYFEGKEVSEIATMTGKSPSTIYREIQEALDIMRKG